MEYMLLCQGQILCHLTVSQALLQIIIAEVEGLRPYPFPVVTLGLRGYEQPHLGMSQAPKAWRSVLLLLKIELDNLRLLKRRVCD